MRADPDIVADGDPLGGDWLPEHLGLRITHGVVEPEQRGVRTDPDGVTEAHPPTDYRVRVDRAVPARVQRPGQVGAGGDVGPVTEPELFVLHRGERGDEAVLSEALGATTCQQPALEVELLSLALVACGRPEGPWRVVQNTVAEGRPRRLTGSHLGA